MKQRLKTFAVILVLVVGFTSLAFCQTLNLSEEYVQSALWIKTNRNTEFYAFYPSESLSNKVTQVSLRWVPFQGMQPLEKEEFFQIAGMGEVATRYRQSQKTAQIFNWTGVALFLAGTALLSGSLILTSENKPLLYASLGLIFGGITAGGIGIIINNTSQIPAIEASEAARLYNENLKRELGLE
jgi:hypothetical protein